MEHGCFEFFGSAIADNVLAVETGVQKVARCQPAGDDVPGELLISGTRTLPTKLVQRSWVSRTRTRSNRRISDEARSSRIFRAP